MKGKKCAEGEECWRGWVKIMVIKSSQKKERKKDIDAYRSKRGGQSMPDHKGVGWGGRKGNFAENISTLGRSERRGIERMWGRRA